MTKYIYLFIFIDFIFCAQNYQQQHKSDNTDNPTDDFK